MYYFIIFFLGAIKLIINQKSINFSQHSNMLEQMKIVLSSMHQQIHQNTRIFFYQLMEEVQAQAVLR